MFNIFDKYKNLLVIVLILAAFTVRECVPSCMGCLELDELTFDKMISNFEYTLTKFDIAFPYGDKHENYAEIARKVGPNIDNLLVSLIGVKDYGEKENSQLAQRYKIDEKSYPVIILFKNYSCENYVKFDPSWDVTVDNIKKFIRENSDIYIGLEGCLREFDELAENFLSSTKKEQKKTTETATDLKDNLANEKDRENAKVYVITMNRIIEKGTSFVAEEQKRINNLLNGKVSDKKKKELTHRLNILQSFHYKDTNSLKGKEEL